MKGDVEFWAEDLVLTCPKCGCINYFAGTKGRLSLSTSVLYAYCKECNAKFNVKLKVSLEEVK